MLMTEIREELNRWRDTLCSWNRRRHVGKMSVSSKVVCRVSATLIKVPEKFCRYTQTILKLTWKAKGTRIAKNNFEQEY